MKKFLTLLLVIVPLTIWFFIVMAGIFMQAMATLLMQMADGIEYKINRI